MSAEFRPLYDAFMDCIPLPHITRPNGAINVASHFPHNAVPPDLGRWTML